MTQTLPVHRLPILVLPLEDAATAPELDADHTHADRMITYDSSCARCVAEQTLLASAKAYRRQYPPTPSIPPTDRQHAVLTFLREHRRTTGRMPTLRAVALHLGISVSSVFMHLQRLERRGHVRRRDGLRGVELVGGDS